MSFARERLIKLFPEALLSRDRNTLLFDLLDSISVEFDRADKTIKSLLKSHWVDYASGQSLDYLGSIYGIKRKRLSNNDVETDNHFRERLKAAVKLYTGGGTVEAIKGAVRSALGLPYSLDQIDLDRFSVLSEIQKDEIKRKLDDLVTIEEFAPEGICLKGKYTYHDNDSINETSIRIDSNSCSEDHPTLTWEFYGCGRNLEVFVDGVEAFHSVEDFLMPPSQSLVLSADISAENRLIAKLNGLDVSAKFQSQEKATAYMPLLKQVGSIWQFRATGARFDQAIFCDESGSGGDTFDNPSFTIELKAVRETPLVFDVYVPYKPKKAVENIINDYKLDDYNPKVLPDDFFVYKGLPPEAIQAVVDDTKAAGVQGRVHFTIHPETERHDIVESLILEQECLFREAATMSDDLIVGSVTSHREIHDTKDTFTLGGVFDVSKFDDSWGFS